jgi:hypothetical protein
LLDAVAVSFKSEPGVNIGLTSWRFERIASILSKCWKLVLLASFGLVITKSFMRS